MIDRVPFGGAINGFMGCYINWRYQIDWIFLSLILKLLSSLVFYFKDYFLRGMNAF
mgnify:CR=1 FL=1